MQLRQLEGLVGNGPRGVKKVKRTPWPMISGVASATEPRFWVEIQVGLIVGGEKSGQNGRTAQQ